MPYDLKTKSGIVLRNIPDDMSPDAPELKQLVQSQLAARPRQPQAPEASDPAEIARMATEGENWGTRALINTGAGFDTALQGIKQLGGKIGIGGGVTDEEIKDKRERDKALADTTTGGGILQTLGEAAPTMIIPFGTGAKVAQLGLRAAGARGAANAIGQGTGRLVADSAVTGALGGAVGPVTEDESRLKNAATGAVVGGALPVVGRGLRQGYEMFTKTGAANRAAREARAAVGDDPAVLRRLVANEMDKPAIPLTSAAVAESPGLARMEAGARARNGADFYDFDQQQGRAVADQLMTHTADAEQLAARRADRTGEWKSNWQQAEQAAQPEVWAKRVPELVQNLEQARMSPEASNPAVRGVLDEVLGEIRRVGTENFTPAHLQQIRANLNARGKAIPSNAYQAAPRDAPAVNSLMGEVDNILNDTTQGAWSGVTDAYRTASRGVDASKAAGRVRESFLDPETGRVRGTALDPRGDVPLITEAGMGRALDRAQGPDKISQLSPEAARGLNQTLEALRRQGITQRVKKSATAGGGSNTASDTMAAQALDLIPGASGGIVGGVISGVTKLAQRRKDQALAEALRDPAAMTQLLTRASRAPGDLTPREQALVQALRSMAVTGSQEELRPQPY